MRYLLLYSGSFLLLLLPCARAEDVNAAIARATAEIEAATPRAQADPAHPIFHITAPAQWINDPNGPIFHHGFYHLFYQLHPFSDQSGPKYWGHVRSRDLVRWEHLPIALWPSTELNEEGVWSGCCTTNGRGEPMIFYTSVKPNRSALEVSSQWAATSDDDLIRWRKLPDNPVLSDALHGEQKIYDWRDPFIFHDAGKTFLVTGGSLNRSQGGQAVVTIYEAENADLTQWKYRGVLFQHPDPDVRTAECPNFFKLGDSWVLFVSPYGKVQYFIGEFDATTCRFHFRSRGLLDWGPCFYAPNTLQMADGRRLVWGWVNGFPSGHGWNGCLSLPRQLSLSRDGQLQQMPAPELEQLRGEPVRRQDLRLGERPEVITLPKTNTLEILAEVELNSAKQFTLEFKRGHQDEPPIAVGFNGSELTVFNVTAPLQAPGNPSVLKLRIFLDRSVMEVFANDIVAITKTIPPLDADARLEIRADGGTVNVRQVSLWPMQSIW